MLLSIYSMAHSVLGTRDAKINKLQIYSACKTDLKLTTTFRHLRDSQIVIFNVFEIDDISQFYWQCFSSLLQWYIK